MLIGRNKYIFENDFILNICFNYDNMLRCSGFSDAWLKRACISDIISPLWWYIIPLSSFILRNVKYDGLIIKFDGLGTAKIAKRLLQGFV